MFSNQGLNCFAVDLALGFVKDRFDNPLFMAWGGGRFDFFIKPRLSFSVGATVAGKDEDTRNKPSNFAMALPMFFQIQSTNRLGSGFIFGFGGIAQMGFGQPFFQPGMNGRVRFGFREKRTFFELQGLLFFANIYRNSYGHGGGVAFSVERFVLHRMFGFGIGTFFK